MTTPETAAEIREQLRGMALSLATGSGPIVEPAAFDAALDAYRDAVLAEQPAVSSAVVAPPADQAALRDRIAEALLDHLSRTADIRTSSSGGELAFMPEVTDAERMRMADAVLAVLPEAADPAAVLREAADALDAGMERFFGEWPDEPRNSPYALGQRDAANELRRMADETATTEVVPCVRPEPHPAHSHSGLRKGTAVHGRCPGVPAAGARQDGEQP